MAEKFAALVSVVDVVAVLPEVAADQRGLSVPERQSASWVAGRFAKYIDVIEHYDRHFRLQLSAMEKAELVEYLKSL